MGSLFIFILRCWPAGTYLAEEPAEIQILILTMGAFLVLFVSMFSNNLSTVQPCPIPNGAAGLALLGKICRKTNRRERAIDYFRMSLQLDPFLFTSFQALAELGAEDLDASAIFGGSVALKHNKQNHSKT